MSLCCSKAQIKKGYQNIKSSGENLKLINEITDKFDSTRSSSSDLNQTHSMAVIMTRKHISKNTPTDSTSSSICVHKTNKDLQLNVFPQTTTYHYKVRSKL